MKKLFIVLIIILAATALLWCGFLYYLVPRVFIPQAREKIAAFNRENKADLKIQGITFHPLRGLQLTGIELPPILTAKEIDIDLDYLALLSGRAHLPQINIIEAKLKVSRSKKGEWNYEPAIKNIFGKKKTGEPVHVDIDRINVSRGEVDFSDNRLIRQFKDVTIKIKNPDREDYFVEASGADLKSLDAIGFEFDYTVKTGRIKGKAELKLSNLADYRDYYLDKLISPWHLSKAQVEARAEFSFCRGDLSLSGEYAIKNGEISYGDIKLAGNGSIKQKSLKNAEVSLENFSLFFEKKGVLEKLKCEADVTGKGVRIKKLQGKSQGEIVDLSGQFVFGPVRRLDLAGKVGASNNIFNLQWLSDNAARANFISSAETYDINVYASFSDIKNLIFNGKISGRLDLNPLPWKELVKVISVEADGTVAFAGDLRGELDKPETLFGKLGLKFSDFSLWGLEPISFLLGMKVEGGKFSSGIPLTELYQGTFTGAVVLDSKRWGIGLDIKKIDLSKFARVKGLFTAKGAVVGNWGDKKSIAGGGIFSLTNADLKNAAIFEVAQQGLGNVVKDFKMPDFKEVKGNFEIANEVVTFGNARANASELELKGSGTIDFQNRADFTMGVKFIHQQGVKTALYVFFPLETLGFDFLTKAVKVDIKGVIPDLKQTTTVQPLSWLTDSFDDPESKFDPSRYTLERLWQE